MTGLRLADGTAVATDGPAAAGNADLRSGQNERAEAILPLPNRLGLAVAGFPLIVALIQPFAVLTKGLSLTEGAQDFFVESAIALALYLLTSLWPSVLGGLILWRKPGHAIGWLLVVGGGLDAIGRLATQYELFGLEGVAGFPSASRIDELFGWLWVPAVASIAIGLPQIFPSGRLLSRRWRPVAWYGIASTALMSAVFGLRVSGSGAELLLDVTNGLFGLACLTGLVPLIVRYRRSRGEERLQLKWAFFGLALCVPLLALGIVGGLIWGDSPEWALPSWLATVILPVTIAMAVLRYRLYDIDVVISKTLLVAGLAGFVTVAYVAIVVGVGSLVGGGDEPNLALSVAATAVVAVAFQPVRRALQRVANRLVFGRRATPYDVLSGFATRVGAAEPSSETLVQLAELMARGTGADPARVWLRVGPDLRPAAMWPPASDSDQRPAPVTITESGARSDKQADSAAGDAATVPALPDADLAVPVRDRGELLGVLTIAKPRGERLTEIDIDLLGRLAAASGVLLRNLRLDAELAQRLTDLEASRRRLQSAQNDARQRIEEDLAGGSRAQLAALRERLSSLAGDVDTGAAPKTALLLAQLVTATDGAMATLDGLAAGVYPPRLASDGLAAALTEQAGKAAVPVSVHAEGVGRYPAEVEAAVYFSVLEALQNVAKYAAADSARVRLAQDDGQLSFEVVDDGAGFDPETTKKGTGLQGMADRLDTVGGTMSVHSAPGRGTTIAGQVPAHPTTGPTPRASAEPALAGATR